MHLIFFIIIIPPLFILIAYFFQHENQKKQAVIGDCQKAIGGCHSPHWYRLKFMRFSKNTLALAVMAATVSLAHTSPVLAETATESTDKKYQPTLMNQVTVTAARSEKQLKDIAGTIVVMDEEQLEKQLATDIRDLVRYEPGISVGSDGRTGSEGFNIRGMEGNRVKIMVDGIDQPQQFDSGFTYQRSQRNFIDIDAIKAVEVVKGPASSLYGSDAIGGIVAYQTKDPSDYLKSDGDDTTASVKGSYTSADHGFAETFTLANRTGDLESMLIYTRRDVEELETHSGADIEGNARGAADPLDTGSNNFLGKLQYQVNDDHRVGLTGEYLDAKTKVKLKSGEKLLPGGTTGEDIASRKRIGAFHEWEAGLTAFDSLRTQLDWQDSKMDQTTWIPATSRYNDRKKVYFYGEKSIQLATQFDKQVQLGNTEHSFVYGFDVNDVKTENRNISYETGKDPADKTYIPSVDKLTYGLFVQDEITLTDRLVLTPGVRFDSYKYSPGGDKLEKSTGNKLTSRLGAVYNLSDELSVFGQYSQGFKAPDLYDMYYTHKGIGFDGKPYKTISNPDLKPEESQSVEFGLRGDDHRGSFEVVAFYNRYSNFIDTFTDMSDPTYTGGITQAQNIGKAEIQGVELRGQLWLDETIGAPMGTTLRGSLAYADGEDKENNQKLNSVAPITAVIGLGYDDLSGNYGGELAWTLVKGKSDSDVSDSEVPTGKTQFNPAGYGLVDLTAYYSPVEDVTLRAGLFNITDKKYWLLEDVRGRSFGDPELNRYTQPGRNFSVSVKWDI
ncbi:TonB-dependent hemoglobin/transferrin/lactoferrin family receptor [Endozoicomonas sp. ALE010]|uniref:TonB-dependent hemoglobin/transferrin/lactoferrin family receptor n=1 Tax=Endozoicomonas sp. ALE010 TaxID=3403081 RepID=UPI003BB7004B